MPRIRVIPAVPDLKSEIAQFNHMLGSLRKLLLVKELHVVEREKVSGMKVHSA